MQPFSCIFVTTWTLSLKLWPTQAGAPSSISCISKWPDFEPALPASSHDAPRHHQTSRSTDQSGPGRSSLAGPREAALSQPGAAETDLRALDRETQSGLSPRLNGSDQRFGCAETRAQLIPAHSTSISRTPFC